MFEMFLKKNTLFSKNNAFFLQKIPSFLIVFHYCQWPFKNSNVTV